MTDLAITPLYAAPPAQPASKAVTVEWAVQQWREQVEHRPLINRHRRSLDDVWRQVIRQAGGDDVLLVGPTHDELIAPPTQPEGGK